MAGCGSGVIAAANPSNQLFSIFPGASSVDTNGQLQFRAVLKSGAPAPVHWIVSGGDANAGAGKIDGNTGLYLPPGYLTNASTRVQVTATLVADPTVSASAVVTVNPGFLQPLSPENIALTPGSVTTFRGQIAQVGGGTLDWSLSTDRNGSGSSPALGSLSRAACESSASVYTTCSISYTAPQILPATPLYVIARVHGFTSNAPAHILLNNEGVNSSPLTNQEVQSGPIALGSSGGNNNDYDLAADPRSGMQYIADCCGGTLGALLNANDGNQYVLSNNHVLAESDQAHIGDSIVQPGLIDSGCTPLEQGGGQSSIGTLSAFVPLANAHTNVDAAIARVTQGGVDRSGSILQLGSPGAGLNGTLGSAPPASQTEAVTADNLGSLQVAKSGRTTGLTCSAIDAVDMQIHVPYYTDCAETNPYYTKNFNGQMLIAGSHFTDAGDSGALVLDARNARPVGLFFASANDMNGNGYSAMHPIGDVLSALSAQSGKALSIAGGPEHPVACLNYQQNVASAPPAMALSASQFTRAEKAANLLGQSLVNPRTGILGVATGRSQDNPQEAAVIVYVDRARKNVAVPQTLGRVRTLVIPTDLNTLTLGKAPLVNRQAAGVALSPAALGTAIAVKRQYARQILDDPAVFGVGVTQSRDNAAEAALLVLIDRRRTPRSTPARVGGLRVRYAYMDRFRVTLSQHQAAPHPSACALKSLPSEAWSAAAIAHRRQLQ